ncbi:Protocadherin-16, partial [Paragonimus heterotremus]
VHADDADRESHARPQYRLLSNDLFPLHFDVEPETGWIVTKADIDRETQAVYQLTVLAIDGHSTNSDTQSKTGTSAQYVAIRQNTATAHVQVKISDDNDNAPEFRGPRQFAVEENQPGPKWIGDLQVMDRDEGINREVEFILPTGQADGLVALDESGFRMKGNQTTFYPSNLPIVLAKNGSLYTTKKLDRENQVRFHSIKRNCFSISIKSHCSFDYVPGNNVSQNHKGISDLPNPTVPVSVNEVPGYCALIAEAHDADEGRNALLHFALKPAKSTNNSQSQLGVPDPTDAFMMDQHSGRLMLTRNLNIEEMGLYPLTISVEDSGTPKYRTEKVVYILIEDSPARGNWLFPDIDRTQGTSIGGKGDTSEAYTILVVIGLSGISAFLAAVLISAILCMIKPCRNANRRRNGDRVHKVTINASTVPGTRYSMNPGDTYIGQADGYDDYNMSLINGNGYIGTADGRSHPRSLLLTTAPIPGLDQLYLPSDKLIGIDSEVPASQSVSEDPGWPSQSNNSTMLSSPFMGRLSPTLPLCHYTLAQPLDSTWIAAPNNRAVWSPVSSPNCSASCNDCQIVYQPDVVFSPQPQPQSQASFAVPFGTSHDTVTNLSIGQPIGISSSAYVNAGLIASPRRPTSSGSYAYPTINTALGTTNNANGIAHGERNGSGEEQRSDSGRGASDEEVPNARATPTNQGACHSAVPNRQFRSATLKSFHENSSHMIPGLVFPSLPRKSPGEFC